MAKYSELRFMSSENLRLLCIKERWYTKGTCDEYGKLLEMPVGKNIKTVDIANIANNICEHSDNVDFVCVCNSLLQICVSCITEN